jgi:hypothetical protein
VNRDADLANRRYQELGQAAEPTLRSVGANPGEVNPTAIQQFRALVEIFRQAPSSATAETQAGISRWVVPTCLGAAVLGVLFALAVVVRRQGGVGRLRRPAAPAVVPEEGYFSERLEAYSPAPVGAVGESLATFRTIYTLGDDLYDDSFSIESPAGDFMGECGVGIADTIGVGQPKKVSGFEVWLFDKNDIQTVTKVLLSRHAYNDEATRNRMATKGDPVLAEPGTVVNLETATLRIEARVVDLVHGEGPLPADSFFQRATLERRAYQKG